MIDPIGLDRLLPDWRSEDTPIKTAVTDDRFYYLFGPWGAAAAEFDDAAVNEQSRQLHRIARQRLPLAGDQSGKSWCRDLSGFAATEVLFDVMGRGGRGRNRRDTCSLENGRSIILRAAWNCAPNTHCSQKAPWYGKQLIAKIWSGKPARPSEVRSRLEGALASRAKSIAKVWSSIPSAGRSIIQPEGHFLYHLGREFLVSVGFVLHLNYSNPYLSAFEEFQRVKYVSGSTRHVDGCNACIWRARLD